MPSVILRARDFGITGYESPTELDGNEVLKQKIESIRLQIGSKMNLGDVTDQTIPKMYLISAPKNGGVINTRTFIPHVCHEAIGVLGAVSVATACIISPLTATAARPRGRISLQLMAHDHHSQLSIEHLTGEFTVNLETTFENDRLIIKKSGVIRMARLLSKGEVFLPI